jgi:hypothetical protein
MSEKKGASTKLLGCVGCLGILLIGGVGVGLVGALGVGGFLAYNTASPPDIVQFDQTTPPVVETVAVRPDPKPVVEVEVEVEAEVDTEADTETEADPEPQGATEAARPAPEPVITRPNPTPAPAPMTRQDPPSEPAPSVVTPAPEPAPSSDSYISLDGDGSVVLVGGGRRHPVPGNVPAGRYDIEVTFSGQEAVSVDRITVREGSNATIRCNARMGVCRSR